MVEDIEMTELPTWRPIDTAPRDGTRIRLGHDRAVDGMKVAKHCPIFGIWDDEEGWRVNAFFMVPVGGQTFLTNEATHWMPEKDTPQ